MKTIVLLLCMLLSSEVYGQAVWRGRSYSHPVCSNPNCRMCNSIRNQLYTPTYQPQFTYSPTYVQPTYTTVPDKVVYSPVSAAQEPTPLDLIPLVFDLLKPTPNDVFIDVGSGDGRVLHEALKHKCTVLGVDLQPQMVSGAKVITGDCLHFDYTNVTMAYLYLYPDLMEQVIDKLPIGTKIVSYSHTTHQLKWERYGNFYLGIKQ